MNGLLPKLQECAVLSMDGTFPDFISNAIIAGDKIRTHKESKKRKDVATSSNSALPKYRVVYPPPSPPTSRVSHTSRPHERLYLHHRL
jgi:hypothetical protein